MSSQAQQWTIKGRHRSYNMTPSDKVQIEAKLIYGIRSQKSATWGRLVTAWSFKGSFWSLAMFCFLVLQMSLLGENPLSCAHDLCTFPCIYFLCIRYILTKSLHSSKTCLWEILLLCSGVRIRHRPLSGVGCSCGSDSTPGQETSAGHGCGKPAPPPPAKKTKEKPECVNWPKERLQSPELFTLLDKGIILQRVTTQTPCRHGHIYPFHPGPTHRASHTAGVQ